MKWPTVAVGEIAQQVRGVSYDKSQVSNSAAPGLRPVLRAGNIQEGSLLLDKDLVYVPDTCIAQQQLLKPGDIVIAASSGSIDVVGKAAQLSEPWEGSFGAFCKVVRPSSDRVNPRYLHHFFQSTGYRRKVSSLAAGANINNLKNEHIDDLLLPLPPLEEQRRVAAILDKAATMRKHANRQLKTAKDLLASAFVETVGDPLKNPNGWSAIPLAEAVQVGTDVTYGIVQAGEEFPGGIPYIRTGDIVDGEIDLSKLRHTDPEIAKRFARSTVRPGEIVMSIRATVGTTALVPACLDGANLTQGTARISPGQCVNGAYLLQYLRMPSTQAWIQRQVKGATFREITLARLRELPVLIPPMEIQEAFATKSCIVNSITDLSKALLARTGNLSTSLASQLLT